MKLSGSVYTHTYLIEIGIVPIFEVQFDVSIDFISCIMIKLGYLAYASPHAFSIYLW